jgi:hypothetical protein
MRACLPGTLAQMAVVEKEPDFDVAAAAHRVAALRVLRLRRLRENPAYLGHFVHCVDAKTGEEFDFDLLTADERAEIDIPGEPGGWHWHREILDAWMVQILSLELKARQIGITWLAALLALWMVLFRPGTRVLILSVNEEEAKKVIARIWGMWQSMPTWAKEHVTVTKPARGGNPSQEIEYTHGDGKRSSILALPSTETAGHGETAALVILDEFSRQPFAKSTWKGTFPVIDGGGRIVIISTANGVSNEQTGEGNFFHYLWVNAMSMNITARFLGWFRHPNRDRTWYTTNASALPPNDRAEQYPETPEDAFINTGECWFDVAKLNQYQERWRKLGLEVRRMRFVEGHLKARKVWMPQGEWRVLKDPEPGHRYAIGADSATGRGTDFSSAHVIDLETAEWVAEFHAKIDPDQFATNLYYAGRLYNDALIAVENQGGYGDSVIIPLRDGSHGRKQYRNLYRHRTTEESPDMRERTDYGYPMKTDTRPLVINQLEQWIREMTLPWITPELHNELRTFSVAKSMPSPRAQDGCNDDRVMSAGISLEMYRQFGSRRRARRPASRSRWKDTLYAWER